MKRPAWIFHCISGSSAGEDINEELPHILGLSRPRIVASFVGGGGTSTSSTEGQALPGGASMLEESTHEEDPNMFEGATSPGGMSTPGGPSPSEDPNIFNDKTHLTTISRAA